MSADNPTIEWCGRSGMHGPHESALALSGRCAGWRPTVPGDPDPADPVGSSTKPSCRMGFSSDDLDALLGDRRAEFDRWMRGQTQAICDGTSFDYASNTYSETECGPHGVVSYSSDVRRFLDGGPIVD